ncbi:MAG: [protein-PII] uridylyltransferase [Pyrinomonadaceae bacterium]|nr:[protein-PII] uridylyltransferase [Pyrinomonadaceae bacterium]
MKIAHRCGAPGRQTASARSSILDLVVEQAYHAATRLVPHGQSFAEVGSGCAVVALGGYGRGELAPYSDLDLLFLHSNHHALQARSLVEQMLRLLWDAGLTVGHSLRSVADCASAAHADPHFQTALVSTRMLAGDATLYDSLLEMLERDRRKRTDAFLAAIRNERDARYMKFGSVVCLQEPNLKESAGGLRDFHTALWAGYGRYGCRTLEELRSREIVTEAEQRNAARAVDFLWRVRYAAHLSTRRKTERLALDLQTTLAREFGYESSAYLLASEAFMRDYYRHARELYRFSETLLARASETETKATHWWNRRPAQPAPAEPLSIRKGLLELEGDAQLFTENPLLIFDAFALAQAASVPFGHLLQEAVRKSLTLLNHKFRASAEASRAFLKLLSRRGRGGYVLRLMHEVGFLGRFMPEFERISLLIQHDLYHHYTVDEHTLKAVEVLDELHVNQDKQRAHLRIIFEDIEDPALLYLSILLHDIGKGRGRGHIPRGVKIAERVCARLGLEEKQAATVLLLVKEHVAMAQLAQRRDLNEPQVVSDFATQVGSLDALNSLMLLTYADLNAVAPGVWSEWKSTLLWEVYRRTRTLLTGTDAIPNDIEKLARFKEQGVNSLEGLLPISEVERHVALLPDRYVRVTRPQAAAIHIHLIKELKNEVFAHRWLRHSRASTELTICTRDRHGLFADIAGTLAAHGIEILSAELNTREDGIALDVFMLREASTHHAIDIQRYPAIERALRKAIAGESDIAALVERWRTKHAPRKRNSTQHAQQHNLPKVVCDNEAAGSCTLIEVHAIDEPGLAYKIASALAELGLDIVCAKIATEKSDALDVFYVTDADGMKLSTTTMISVEVTLAERLRCARENSIIAETIKNLRRRVDEKG